MLIARGFHSLCALVLSGLLASCGPEVEVNFAHPFPRNAPDLSGFPSRYQGLYVAAEDTGRTLLVGNRQVVQRRFHSRVATARQLDSLGLPPRSFQGRGLDGQRYDVQAMLRDSFRLRWEQRDTLVALGPGVKLRRYRGWYYLSAPNSNGATWTVQRLAVVGQQFFLQRFNPDSLRIQALDPATVRQRRANGNLIFTLDPSPGRATWQVDGYDGLWLSEEEHLRKVLKIKLEPVAI